MQKMMATRMLDYELKYPQPLPKESFDRGVNSIAMIPYTLLSGEALSVERGVL